MSQIKKYAAVGGAVGLVACWPLVVGQITQNTFEREMNAVPGQWVQGKTLAYDRGYLSTHIEVEFKVIDPELKREMEADGFPDSVVWVSDVHHGLFSVDADTRLKDYPDLPLTIKSNTTLTGHTKFTAKLGALDHQSGQADDSWSLVSTPGTITGEQTSDKELDYQFDMSSLAVKFVSGGSFQMDGLSGGGHGKKDKYFWLGKQSANMKKFTITDALTQESFVLNDMSYQSDISQDKAGKRLNIHQVMKTAAVETSEGSISAVDFDLSFNNLDKDSLIQMISAAEQRTGSVDQSLLVNALNQLVKQGFSLALNHFNVTLEDGQIQTAIQLKLPEGIENVLQNPQKLMNQLQGNVHGVVPKALIDKDPSMRKGFDELIVMDMAKEKENSYEINATIKDGNLIFESGEKMPLTSSFMLLMYFN